MGRVALVGSGPGDPLYLTIRARQLLEAADVVVVDFLIDRRVKALVRDGVEIIDVGKRPGQPFSQEEINRLLVELSGSHRLVVRLKGGDPLVFGRGGEELSYLLAHKVAVEVVPGISSAMAAPLVAGVPLTQRGHANGYLVITGHLSSKAPLSYDWEALVRSRLTIVVLMGIASRAEIAHSLIGAGMAGETDVMVITSATWARERVLHTTLAQLPDAEIESPSVIVIGTVAGLDLDWRHSLPLGGLKIMSTRPLGDKPDELALRLTELGATVIQNPSVSISGPSGDGSSLDEAASRIEEYDWLLFTSVNAVSRFLPLIGDLRRLATVKIAVIGQGTASRLRDFRLEPDLIPDEFVGEALVEAFPSGPGKVLFPRARVARDVVPEGLAEKGFDVDLVEAYQSLEIPALIDPEEMLAMDMVVFTASSTVKGFVSQFGSLRPRATCAIGPITAATLEQQGFKVDVMAEEYSIDGLVKAIVTFFENRGQG